MQTLKFTVDYYINDKKEKVVRTYAQFAALELKVSIGA